MKNHSCHDCQDSCCLRLQGLTVRIGGETILDNINLHVHCGQLVALIGPNGAGKSTLIRSILGQRDYEGTIAFSTPGSRAVRPRIGYVPQSPSFDRGDPMSVLDLFICCTCRRPAFLSIPAALRHRVEESLAKVNSESLISRRVGDLSGGELQRVLLALALEPMPNILILDEPLSGVDIEGMETLMDMISQLRRTYDLSILMTTHDFSLLERYADQVVLLDSRILCQGMPAEVLRSDAFYQAFHMKGGETQ